MAGGSNRRKSDGSNEHYKNEGGGKRKKRRSVTSESHAVPLATTEPPSTGINKAVATDVISGGLKTSSLSLDPCRRMDHSKSSRHEKPPNLEKDVVIETDTSSDGDGTLTERRRENATAGGEAELESSLLTPMPLERIESYVISEVADPSKAADKAHAERKEFQGAITAKADEPRTATERTEALMSVTEGEISHVGEESRLPFGDEKSNGCHMVNRESLGPQEDPNHDNNTTTSTAIETSPDTPPIVEKAGHQDDGGQSIPSKLLLLLQNEPSAEKRRLVLPTKETAMDGTVNESSFLHHLIEDTTATNELVSNQDSKPESIPKMAPEQYSGLVHGTIDCSIEKKCQKISESCSENHGPSQMTSGNSLDRDTACESNPFHVIPNLMRGSSNTCQEGYAHKHEFFSSKPMGNGIKSQPQSNVQLPDVSIQPPNEEVFKFKEEGNRHFKAGDAQRAIDSYTRALEIDPSWHVIYSNRAAAYSQLGEHQKALQDAEMCIQLDPTFLKGHSRRAAALLALKRPLEAVQAADLGLSLVSRPDASGVEVLHQTRRSAQHQLLDRVIKGKWKGSVHPTLGGYEQIFEFGQNPSQMTITVMDRPVPARYALKQSTTQQALGMDITAIADGSPSIMEPPTVPYIYRLFYIDPETAERKEYKGTNELPTFPSDTLETATGSADVYGDDMESFWDEKLQWEMEMCSPFMSLSRPQRFEGPGFVVMKKCYRPISRRIAPEVENMCFNEQLSQYLEELLKLEPDAPLEEPSAADDQVLFIPQMTCASKIGTFMRCQREVYELGRKYPDPVSVLVEELLASPEQLLSVGPSIPIAKIVERREGQLESLSLECRHLLEKAKLHINNSGFHLLQFSISSTVSEAPATASEQQSSYRPPFLFLSSPFSLWTTSPTEVNPTTVGSEKMPVGDINNNKNSSESKPSSTTTTTTTPPSIMHGQASQGAPGDSGKQQFDEVLKQEPPKCGGTNWCKAEKKTILVTSTLIIALGAITYLLMKNRTSMK